MRLSRWRGQRARSRAIQRVEWGLLLALGLVNQMSDWARVNRKALYLSACKGSGDRAQAARMVSRGSCIEAEGDRREGVPSALNSKAMPVGKCIAPQMVWTVSGMAPRTSKSS